MIKLRFLICAYVLVAVIAVGCGGDSRAGDVASSVERPAVSEIASPAIRKVIESAVLQTKTTTGYTQEYFVIPYPNGDVPIETGACTDVVIRSFRSAGVDLQKEVHQDMSANFASYPKKWGLAKTDTNIDHRRVPNL